MNFKIKLLLNSPNSTKVSTLKAVTCESVIAEPLNILTPNTNFSAFLNMHLKQAISFSRHVHFKQIAVFLKIPWREAKLKILLPVNASGIFLQFLLLHIHECVFWEQKTDEFCHKISRRTGELFSPFLIQISFFFFVSRIFFSFIYVFN